MKYAHKFEYSIGLTPAAEKLVLAAGLVGVASFAVGVGLVVFLIVSAVV